MKLKRILLTLLTVACTAIVIAGPLGCDAGASCKETCDEDADCADGMGCFITNEGHICLPSSCGTCFEDGRTCNYSENLSEQADGEAAECSFTECTY